jgi:hypothetical protein
MMKPLQREAETMTKPLRLGLIDCGFFAINYPRA